MCSFTSPCFGSRDPPVQHARRPPPCGTSAARAAAAAAAATRAPAVQPIPPRPPSSSPLPQPHYSGARCCGGCLASVPLLQLLCTLVILAGTIVYSVKGGAAFAAVRALFDKLSVSAPAQAKAAAASSGLLGAGIAVLLCMLALSTIATIAAAMGKRRRHAIRNGGAGELPSKAPQKEGRGVGKERKRRADHQHHPCKRADRRTHTLVSTNAPQPPPTTTHPHAYTSTYTRTSSQSRPRRAARAARSAPTRSCSRCCGSSSR